MPVAQTRPAPGLARPRPGRFPSRYRKQLAILLFRYAVEIVPTRFKDYSQQAAAFLLEPLQFYLFGLLEKIFSGGVWRLRRKSGHLPLLPDFLPGQCVLELLKKLLPLPPGHLRKLLDYFLQTPFGRRLLGRLEPEELIGGHFENVGELDQRIGSDTRNLPFPSQHGLLCHAEHLRELSLRNAGLLTCLHDAFAEGGSQLGGGSSFACHAAIIRRFLEK